MVETVRYQNALDFLYSYVDFSLTRQLSYSVGKFNLDRMEHLLKLMGDPQKNYPIIHVAGTKGKGSICAILSSIYHEAGNKVGLYTSPHLSDYCERIQINGQFIPHDEFIEQIDAIRPLLTQVKDITTFEITTAIAFKYFSLQKIDIAIIEVGLGGRLDATNVLIPMVSVISSISFDHMGVLGNSINAIAIEKAGIIKEGHPVVLAPQVFPEASDRIGEVASRKHSKLFIVENENKFRGLSHSLKGQKFILETKNINILKKIEKQEYFLPLLGFHQIENAVTALGAIDLCKEFGFDITLNEKKEGLKNVRWPGRFEIVRHDPLIIIDSAHNSDSAKKLHRTMEDYLGGYKKILIFGISEDKDIKGMYKYLLPGMESVIFTKSSHPRAAEPEKLVELAKEYLIPYKIADSIEKAIEYAILDTNDQTAIVVAGSIFVAAAARDELLKTESRNKNEG